MSPGVGALGGQGSGQCQLPWKHAHVAAGRSMELLGGLPRIDEGEAYIRLAYAEALRAAGDGESARAAIQDAWTRLSARAKKIADERVRERFLTKVPENARTAELARALRGD